MATERIKLFEADIDTDGIVKKSVELREQMVELRQNQKLLKMTVGETNEEFIKNEARLKSVSKEYRLNQMQVSNLTDQGGQLLTVQQKLTLALNKEIVSISSATKNNAELKKIRNEVNIETEEGQKAIAEINARLDQNTAVIKGNVSALEEQKIGIGNYKESIKEALDETNIFKGGISNLGDNISVFTQKAKEAGGTGAFLKNSLSQAATGFYSLTKAAVGFIFTPVGAILAVLVGAFALVKSAMDRSETATNKIKKAFSAFQGITNSLLKILEPLGSFLIDGIVKGFELAEKAIYKGIDTIAASLELLGFDNQAKSLRNFNAEVQEGAKDAKALADAEAQLLVSQREARRVQLEYQKDAEKLRQMRDNDQLSIKDRISANDQLGKVLKQQLSDELKIAEQALIVANLRIKSEGQTAAALDEQAEALTVIADIQERITGQQSEQLTNRVSLEKEGADKARDAANKRIEIAEKELDLLKEQRRFNIQTLDEQKFIADQEIKILDQKLKSRILSETEYKTEVLKLQNDLKQSQIEFNEAEIERIQDFNERKNEIQNEIDLRTIENETARELAKAEMDFEKQVAELENLNLTEQEKTELLALIETERQQIVSAIAKEGFDQRLEEFKKFSDAEIQARQQNAQEAAAIASQLTGILSGILGDSLAAKLASLAVDAAIQAGLVSVTSTASQANNLALAAAVGFPANLTTIPAALSQNLAIKASSTKAITKIIGAAALKGLGTAAGSLRKAEHGMSLDIGGQRHSSGGTKFYGEDGTAFEAEAGEKMFILNRQASAALAPLLSDINQQYGGVSLSRPASYLAAGGQVIRNSKGNTGIDVKSMTDEIKRAVMEGSAEGTRTGAREGSREGSASGTYSGIVDREDNNKIAAGANF